MSLFQPYNRAHGIDISDFMIRIMEVSTSKSGAIIYAYGEMPLEKGWVVEGEIRELDKVKIKLQDLYKNTVGRVSSPFIIISVPERKTFSKVITLENIQVNQMGEAMHWEVEQHFPVSLDDVYVSWSPVGTTKNRDTVLLSATEKSTVDQYVSLFEDIGKHVIVAEPESQAVQRALLPNDSVPTIIIDLGASKTSLSIVSQNAVHYTSTIGFSGRELTKLLSEQLHLTLDQGERAKSLFGLNAKKGKGVVKKILVPSFEPLLRTIEQIQEYYTSHYSFLPPLQQVLLCGGGSMMEGIESFLSEKLSLPTKKVLPLINRSKNVGRKFPEEKTLSFATAIGLALRSHIQKPFELVSQS